LQKVCRFQDLVYLPKFSVSLLFSFFCQFINFYSHATSCTPCAKAKAAYKPFDTDKAYVKTRAKIVQRLKAKRTKQQMDIE